MITSQEGRDSENYRRTNFSKRRRAFSEFLLSTSVDRWRDLSVIPLYLLAPSPTLIIRTYSSHVLNQPFGIFVETTEDKQKDDHWSFSESVSSFPLSFFHSCLSLFSTPQIIASINSKRFSRSEITLKNCGTSLKER